MLNSPTHFRLSSLFRSGSLLFFVFVGCFAFWLIDFWRPYNLQKGETNFVWDMFGYYSYLPALFQNNGSFQFPPEILTFNPASPTGMLMPKYTYGVALLQLPFFLLAWAFSSLTGAQGSSFTGYYIVFQEYGALIYVLLGLFLLRKVLLSYFSEITVAFTLFVMFFGSLLFHYTMVQAEMSHAYLFFLFCVFIYLSKKWHEKSSKITSILLALVIAVISLIRPTEIFIFLFFVLWQVRSMAELKTNVANILQSKFLLVCLVLASAVIWLPQFVFWKHYAGQFLFDSYQNEQFFWLDPQITNVLFSYRKGWFTYTPLIFVAVIGFFINSKALPISNKISAGLTFVMVYVYSCWWDWDYGGCYGAREFTQHIAYLSFPLANVFERLFNSNYQFVMRRLTTLVVVAFCFLAVTLTIGQSYQYQVQRKIHPNRMSKGLYWELFGTYQYSKRFDDYTFWSLLNTQHFEDWRAGKNRDDNN